MKLLFIHSEEKVRIDTNGEKYTDGSYDENVWSRYRILADDITLIARRENGYIEPEEAIQKYNRLKNIRFVEIPNLKNSTKEYFSIRKRNEIKEILKREISCSDCVIVRLHGNGQAIEICENLGKPYLVEVVGCVFDSYWNYSIKGKILAVPMFLIMKKYIKRAKNVVYVTTKFLQERYPTKGNNVGISDVDIQVEETILSKREKNIAITKELIVIGTIGGLEVVFKGHEHVIKAIGILKNKHGIKKYVYEIVGSGNSQRLRRIAIENGVEEQVIFKGSIPHDKINEWLDQVDIYIQPSKQEGMPRSVIEAMARGCLCIGTNVGGMPEIISEQYLCNKSNITNELVEMLKDITSNEYKIQVKKSIECAKKFNSNYLDKKRMEFYKKSLLGE